MDSLQNLKDCNLFCGLSKVTKLLQDKQDIELELKFMYRELNQQNKAKVITKIKENPKVFFSYAKARQKTAAKVGPFIDPAKPGPWPLS